MSASPFASSPSLSWFATRFAASAGSPTVMSAMPAGLTNEGSSSVTAPTKPIVTSSNVWVKYSGSAGAPVPFRTRSHPGTPRARVASPGR